MVHLGGEPKFSLAVHENTHIYTGLNWCENTSSFLSEGIAKHVEAEATDPDQDHRLVVEFLKRKELFPLAELITHNIGLPGPKTRVGYPAAGSFTGFLLEKYGLETYKEFYRSAGVEDKEESETDRWQKTFKKQLEELELEWLNWLATRYRIEEKYMNDHFEHLREYRRLREEIEADKPGPEEWPQYTGIYEWMEMGKTFEIRIDEEALIMVSADMPDVKIELIPVVKNGFRMKGGPMDGAVLIFKFDDDVITEAHLGDFTFIRK
jgi:hypothetical protein